MAAAAVEPKLPSSQRESHRSRKSDPPLAIKSDFLNFDAPKTRSVRLSSVLLHYSRPDGINPVPLGSSWSLDVFCRIHNGLRRELVDLYNMIDAMQKRVHDLRTSDLKAFFIWWNLFSSYLEAMISCYDDVLWPWISSKLKLSECAPSLNREQTRKAVEEFLNKFDVIYDHLSRRPPDETMARMIKSMADLHPIVEYIGKLEATLPDLVENSFELKEAKRIEKDISRYFHNKGDPDYKKMHLLIMARGMSDQLYTTWKKTLPFSVRMTYKTMTKRFNATHLAAVSRLSAE